MKHPDIAPTEQEWPPSLKDVNNFLQVNPKTGFSNDFKSQLTSLFDYFSDVTQRSAFLKKESYKLYNTLLSQGYEKFIRWKFDDIQSWPNTRLQKNKDQIIEDHLQSLGDRLWKIEAEISQIHEKLKCFFRPKRVIPSHTSEEHQEMKNELESFYKKFFPPGDDGGKTLGTGGKVHDVLLGTDWSWKKDRNWPKHGKDSMLL